MGYEGGENSPSDAIVPVIRVEDRKRKKIAKERNRNTLVMKFRQKERRKKNVGKEAKSPESTEARVIGKEVNCVCTSSPILGLSNGL